MKCLNCSSADIHTDGTSGPAYCGDCGMVQEDDFVVSTLQFNSTGNKSTLCGKMVNIDNTNIGTKFTDPNHYIRNTIISICSKLTLGNEHVECAFRWYKLCLQHSISKGKSILYTLSACIYISCRQEGTPHLLIDFSNELRIDMFRIGRAFLKLRSFLSFDVPLADPSLYMHRFVSHLNFKNRLILDYSIRLVFRMKKDWISTGRRPNNTCGAALLIASRIHGEPRTLYEIAAAVRASPGVIAKRLAEIAETESANLGIEEFKGVWLDCEEDPPIMKCKRKRTEQCSTPADTMSEVIESSDMEKEEESFDVDDLILGEDEVKQKEKIWESMYGDYIVEQEIKKKNRQRTTNYRKKVKRHEFSTVEEAFLSLDRKVSSKLNYAAIDSLFDPS